jgi:hypothetical protein
MKFYAKRFLSVCGLALLLAGCSANLTQLNQASDLSSFAEALRNITVADLNAATARAVAANDVEGAACYPVLAKYIAQGLPGVGKVAGAFDAFEAARLGQKKVGAGIPTDLKMGCAPLMMDERDMVIRLMAIAHP